MNKQDKLRENSKGDRTQVTMRPPKKKKILSTIIHCLGIFFSQTSTSVKMQNGEIKRHKINRTTWTIPLIYKPAGEP